MSTQSYYLTEFEREANRHISSEFLCINCAGIVDDETFFTTASRLDFYLMYLIEGEIETCIGNMHPGDMVIFPPSCVYSYKSINRATYLWIHFTGYGAGDFLCKNLIAVNKINQIGIHETLKSHFEDIFFEFMLNDSQSEEMKKCILKEFLILAGRYQDEDKSFSAPLKSISYINKNYTKNISIEELAQLEGISLTSYRILFKKHTGTSPLQYINARKISAACRMLSEKNIPVSKVSSVLGFTDPYYFSRLFKARVGISPKKYQKENLKII